MEVSPATFAEIKAKLSAAGYNWAIHDDGTTLDMHGIALQEEATRSKVLGDLRHHEDRVGDAFTCGSRRQPGRVGDEDVDVWLKRPNGDRCCSYCGSLHPGDFEAALKDAADPDSNVRVSQSDKRYKWYIDGRVQNAGEGGIKFYTWHVDSKETEQALNAVIGDACRASEVKLDGIIRHTSKAS